MKICQYCQEELPNDAVRCLECGHALPAKKSQCEKCSIQTQDTIFLSTHEYCKKCAFELIKAIIVSTTNFIENRKVKKYFGVESTEVVIGTGLWSELSTEISDFFGQRSTSFEKKLNDAKKVTINKLKYIAASKGANAVIGVDLDYTEFSNNRIGIIASGTLVDLE